MPRGRRKDYRLAHHPQTPTSIVIPQHVIDRMFAQAVLDPSTGCWLYMPSNGNKPTRGYPNLNWNNKQHTVALHRLALIVGTDAPASDLTLDALHSCENCRCVNPAHIRLGTNRENSADYWRSEWRRRFEKMSERLSVPQHLFCEAA